MEIAEPPARSCPPHSAAVGHAPAAGGEWRALEEKSFAPRIVRASPAPAPAPPVYIGIQYLRAVAALMVVVFHIERDRLAFAAPHFAASGAAGVDLFFVISGFIMAATSQGLTPKTFMLRRIIRIVPLYWLFTTLLFAALLAGGSHSQAANASASGYLLSLAFLPYFNPAHGGLYPLLIQGWTLNYEIAFYLVFAACLFLSPRLRLLAIGGLFAALALVGLVAPPETVFAFYTNQIILEFVVGMALAYVATSTWRLPTAWACAFVAVGAVALLFGPPLDSRFLARGVPAALIVWGFVNIERNGDMPRIPVLAFLGDASYSIYLSHLLTLAAVKVGWKMLHLDQSAMAAPFTIACAVASVGAGALVYVWVERPVTLRLRRFARPVRAEAVGTA